MPTSKLESSIARASRLAALVLGSVALSGCGGGGSDPETGSLSVNLTAAPVDCAVIKLQNGVTGVLTGALP